MAYKVSLSNKAVADIGEIATSLATYYSEKIKLTFLVDVTEKMLLLEKMPFIYRKSSSKLSIRECIVNNYVIMYCSVQTEKMIVDILTLKKTSTRKFI